MEEERVRAAVKSVHIRKLKRRLSVKKDWAVSWVWGFRGVWGVWGGGRGRGTYGAD